MLSWKLKD